jgi:8-oxo-dGTP pyrophosphatase MutT (NUDIX family)
MSDEELRWKLGTRHAGGDYKIFTTSFVDATHPPTGKSTRYSLITCVDWVNIIALTAAQEVVLIRQYRPGTDTVCIEIPGGMIDPGEDPLTAAKRELEEETGYTSARWEKLGAVKPNPAIQNNHLHSYLALDAQLTHSQKLDGAEVVTLHLAPLADVHAMLRDGRIDHALVVDAFAHLAFRAGSLRGA